MYKAFKLVFLIILPISFSQAALSEQTVRDLSFLQGSLASKFFNERFNESPPLKEIKVHSLKSKLKNRKITEIAKDIYFYDYQDGAQIIAKSLPIERQVLEYSSIDRKPTEYVTVVGFTADSVIHFGEFYTSMRAFEVTGEISIESMKSFFKKLSKAGYLEEIKSIQIIHSHPVYETYHLNRESTFPIHHGDFLAAKMVSAIVGVPMLFTAVLPNGYSYTSYIKRNQNMTRAHVQDVANFIKGYSSFKKILLD